jgi:acyl-CoA thioester hydrolase
MPVTAATAGSAEWNQNVCTDAQRPTVESAHSMPNRDRSPVSAHRLRRRVQFYEADPAGIVHFSWFFRYMEEAEHGLWRSAGLSIAPTDELAFPRVAAAFDYRRPLRFEDEFDVLIEIVSIKEKTIGYACTVTREETVCAVGTMTIGCVSYAPGQTLKAVPFPHAIVDRFAAADAQ